VICRCLKREMISDRRSLSENKKKLENLTKYTAANREVLTDRKVAGMYLQDLVMLVV